MICSGSSPLAIYDMVGQDAIPQGADWDVSLIYKENNTAVDFSTYSAKMQVRRDYDQEIILELSSGAGTIQLGSGAGNTPNVVLKFTSSATSAMVDYSGIWDLEVISPTGQVLKFVHGKFELEREVTK